MVSMMVMCSFTNWLKSLSPLDTTTVMPCLAAVTAKVAITSSASTPGTSNTVQPSMRTMAWMGSICERKSSGMGDRLALYAGYISSRKVGPLASNTQAANWVGTSLRRACIMLIMPRMAPVAVLVGSPGTARRSGMAWKAR